jgi:alpha-tubulin suppressor-like RCC1 family protein
MRNGAALANETNQDILINPVQLADNGARYSVRVTDALGRSVTSRGALLTVNAVAPVIVNQPVDVQVTVGANAVFIAASTSSVAQTLQWKRCDAGAACPADPASWPDVAGQTSTQLTLPTVAQTDSGARVAMCASNAGGTSCSNTATLTVLPAPVQPVVITPPQPVTVSAGTSASFTVVATGGSLSYEWRSGRDGVNFAPEGRCTNSATCTFSNVALGDDGLLLRVRVFNSAGQAFGDPPPLLTVRLAAGVALARVGGGTSTSLGLRGDGRLVEWGTNNLALPGTPVVRATPTDAATIASGNTHALAIRTNGEVFAWGSNTNGQLGDGTTSDAALPQPVPGLAAARSVAAGIGQPDAASRDNTRYSLAVNAANGLVFAWGTNLSGQLGIGTTAEQRTPVPVGRISGVAGVAAGGGHVLARRSDGSVWVWGRNTSGQLGSGDRTASLRPIPIALADIVAVAAGSDFSVALRNDGTVFTWGQVGFGKLGDDSSTSRSTPAAIVLPAPAIGIAAGTDHALALLLDGRVYAWGRNDSGQTGTGSVSIAVTPPQRVVAPLPANVVAIGTGVYHSLALDANGAVWGWGQNTTRQLFDGTPENRFTPVQVQGVNLN